MFKKFAALYALVRQDARILWHALRHPARPAWLRPAVGLVALYLLSPIDLIPDVLPVIGIVDDLVLIPMPKFGAKAVTGAGMNFSKLFLSELASVSHTPSNFSAITSR